MENISLISLEGRKGAQQRWRECFVPSYKEWISKTPLPCREMPNQETLRSNHSLIRGGQDLTFEQAFGGMCYVLASTNAYFFDLFWGIMKASNPAQAHSKACAVGVAFLTAMADKEAFRTLTPEEVAGTVAATLLDTMFRLDIPKVIETCGMGGDEGFYVGGSRKKTINASTLSALVLSALGLPTIKHGSYKNTSAVGSTDAIEHLGARISMSSVSEIMEILRSSNFCYIDAHLCKTVHDLSHLLEIETINHVIGPMSLPVSRETEVNKLMGVNKHVHPEVIAEAYTILHRSGIQRVGGVIVVGGLGKDMPEADSDPSDPVIFKKYCVLDEVSPYRSVISMAYQDTFLGSFFIRPEDFGVSINPEAVLVANEPGIIHQANIAALRDTDSALADYLGINAALGLFAERHLSNGDAIKEGRLNFLLLRECYRECRAIIRSGQAMKRLVQYIETSGGTPSFM